MDRVAAERFESARRDADEAAARAAEERERAEKAAEAGCDGLIAVNDRAGGHTGSRSPEELLVEVGEVGLPVVCAGGHQRRADGEGCETGETGADAFDAAAPGLGNLVRS